MYGKRILGNFEPFDDMQRMYNNPNYIFANCAYCSCLTVANYYKKDVLPILIDPVFIYEFVEMSNIFRINVINNTGLHTLLNDMNIAVYEKSPDVESLENELLTSISSGYPIALLIDMFYQPGRTDWYQKKHGLWHGLLVYGYDLNENIVNIIDDIKGLNKYSMSFRDLKNCYQGLLQSDEYIEGKSMTFFKYVSESCEGICLARQEIFLESCIDNFVNKMMSYKNRIIESLKSLKALADAYERVFMDVKIIDSLNSTIYRRLSEHYRLLYLFKNKFDVLNIHYIIDSLGNEIIDSWKIVRSITARDIFSNKVKCQSIEHSGNLIKNIYEKEGQYYELLFSLIDEWRK